MRLLERSTTTGMYQLTPHANSVGRQPNTQQPHANISTFLRIKPPSSTHVSCVLVMPDKRTVTMSAPEGSHSFRTKNRNNTLYKFTKVFDVDCSQETLYADTVKNFIVNDFLHKKNIQHTVACYGVTNSGKTHSMHGTVDDPGLVLRAIAEIFNRCLVSQPSSEHERVIESVCPFRLDELQVMKVSKVSTTIGTAAPVCVSENDGNDYAIWISVVENSGEKLYDLLSDESIVEIKRLPTRPNGTYLQGTKQVRVFSFEHAIQVLEAVELRRSTSATEANITSSRSHCLTSIYLVRIPSKLNKTDDVAAKASVSRLLFVDLAGSERYRQTLATGDRLKEASDINKSLQSFKNCIAAIRSHQTSVSMNSLAQQQHIPYRDSKLTQILEPDLAAGHLDLIVTVNPDPIFFDVSTHVMEFSAVARDVRITNHVDSGMKKSNNVHQRLKFRTEQVATSPVQKVKSLMRSASALPRMLTPKRLQRKHVETVAEEISQQSSCRDCGNLLVQLEKLKVEAADREYRVRDEMIKAHNIEAELVRQEYEAMLLNQLADAEQNTNLKIDLVSASHSKKIDQLESELQSLEQQLKEKNVMVNQLQCEKHAWQATSSSNDSVEENRIQQLIQQFETHTSKLEDLATSELQRLRDKSDESNTRKDKELGKLKSQLTRANHEIRQLLTENESLEERLEESARLEATREEELNHLRLMLLKQSLPPSIPNSEHSFCKRLVHVPGSSPFRQQSPGSANWTPKSYLHAGRESIMGSRDMSPLVVELTLRMEDSTPRTRAIQRNAESTPILHMPEHHALSIKDLKHSSIYEAVVEDIDQESADDSIATLLVRGQVMPSSSDGVSVIFESVDQVRSPPLPSTQEHDFNKLFQDERTIGHDRLSGLVESSREMPDFQHFIDEPTTPAPVRQRSSNQNLMKHMSDLNLDDDDNFGQSPIQHRDDSDDNVKTTSRRVSRFKYFAIDDTIDEVSEKDSSNEESDVYDENDESPEEEDIQKVTHTESKSNHDTVDRESENASSDEPTQENIVVKKPETLKKQVSMLTEVGLRSDFKIKSVFNKKKTGQQENNAADQPKPIRRKVQLRTKRAVLSDA